MTTTAAPAWASSSSASVPRPRHGGTPAAAWREQVLAQVARMRALLDAFGAQQGNNGRKAETARIVAAAHEALEVAERTARGEHSRSRRASVVGADVERAMFHLDVASAHLLRIASIEYVEAHLPDLRAQVEAHLTARDPRRRDLERLVQSIHRERAATPSNGGGRRASGEADAVAARRLREAVIAIAEAASAAGRREVSRVRSFRNVLWAVAGTMTVLIVCLVIVGWSAPERLALCFEPAQVGDGSARVVCPTAELSVPATTAGPGASRVTTLDPPVSSWDVLLVAGLGFVAAALSSAAALRDIKGTSTPFALPLALAALKLPTGALTAVLGILLLRGEFVPGLSALDSSGQILAWAIVFGYGQQLFTRLVDQRGQRVLDDVGQTPPTTKRKA